MRQNIGNYVIGIDAGIGSVGWAVIRLGDKPRIERFGVEIFESGEKNNGKDRLSQERRGFRAVRRLLRRRSHRKMRLKHYLDKINFCKVEEVNRYFEGNEKNVIELRVRALDEKVSPSELVACLIHICNMRGYADFYENTDDDVELKEDMQGVDAVRAMLKNYRSVAELYWKDETFAVENSEFRFYRNRSGSNRHYLAPRDALEKEVDLILTKQSEFYPALTKSVKDDLACIIFSQRSFEEGPGNPNDKTRKYKGFLDTIGMCSFYKDETRGQRYTFLSDLYSLVNCVSQYQFFNAEDGERGFSPALAKELLETGAKNASMTVTELKAIAKKHGYKIIASGSEKSSPITNSIKYLKAVKPTLTKFGFDWDSLIEDAFANRETSFLQRLGEKLSSYITPRKRRGMLPEIDEIKSHANSSDLIDALTKIKCSGTERVCYKYMIGAIEAFAQGDIYGKYQAKKIEEIKVESETRYEKLPPFDKTFEFYDNPVVMRSINETRKIINRIVAEYGSPYAINLEVGKDLNKSADNRALETKRQKDNEGKRISARKTIAELLGKTENDVTEAEMERYILGEQQDWKCMYSGRSIDMRSAIENSGKAFEVDHIIPFSLILDNTLQNKVLVYAIENQTKGQRAPLEYLEGEKRKNYLASVNRLFPKKISKTKYAYLMAKSTYDSELIKGWKSRNLNDTRYISKFLVEYLSSKLVFAPREKGIPYRPVYALNGAVTSMMRRNWLRRETWGRYDKEELKKVTYLDHAADAIVIANCLPVYVELNVVHKKLQQILGANKGMRTEEYEMTLEKAKEYISRYYGMSEARIESYLTMKKGSYPSMIRSLWKEVDFRLVDHDIFRIFEAERCDREGLERREYTDEEIDRIFRKNMEELYADDLDFAHSIKMPMTVHKVNHKSSGQVTDSNPVRVVDGKQMSRKYAMSLMKKDIPSIYSADQDLIDSLNIAFQNADEKSTLGKLLQKADGDLFVTQQGTKIRKVTLLSTAKRTLKKEIDETNFTLLTDTSYYAMELYQDANGFMRTTGIAYSDIMKKNGKLWLSERYSYPEDYAKHVTYLFPYDFIRIYDKNNKLKFEGYYRSVFSINTNSFYYLKNNTPLLKKGKGENAIADAWNIVGMKNCITIGKEDRIEKFEVDLFGEIKGEIGCGEPLSLIREND